MKRGTLRAAAIAITLGFWGAAFGGVEIAEADVVWLCKPGMQPNPCRDSLETTVQESASSSHVESPPLPADPPVDCFYVYPTVSGQLTTSSNKNIDPELVAVAQQQASRYSQTCRVYAPVYRQRTLLALTLGDNSPAAAQLAYSDVLEAWNEYLASHNGGRGVVLIGHSQGTRMLRRLAREEIDPRPEVRNRLISAILLGANVTVRKGQRAGGDFAQIPACTSPDETGCVIAFSAFNEPPPANSRFGRVPSSPDTTFNMPTGPDYEVLCTNPASLGANQRAPLTSYLRSEPFPGLLGLFTTVMYGALPPHAPTPWIRPYDRYSGRCEQSNGANVLMIESIDGARRLNPSPEPSWGLHLADANIALGDLVGVVVRQAATYLAGSPQPPMPAGGTAAGGAANTAKARKRKRCKKRGSKKRKRQRCRRSR